MAASIARMMGYEPIHLTVRNAYKFSKGFIKTYAKQMTFDQAIDKLVELIADGFVEASVNGYLKTYDYLKEFIN